MSDILVDLVHQFAHALERTAPDGLLGDQCEPALNLVEPACVGRGVVYVEAGMPRQPRFDPRMLVGAVVVAIRWTASPSGTLRSRSLRKARNSWCRWHGLHWGMTEPSSTSSAANSVVVPCR